LPQAPRDEIYLFQKYLFEKFGVSEGIQEYTPYNMLSVNDDTAVVTITYFAPPNVGHVQTPFL